MGKVATAWSIAVIAGELAAAAIPMGVGVVRIGFGDSAFLDSGEYAEYNRQVVERLVRLFRAMGPEPATPVEARRIMGTPPRVREGGD